MAERHMAMCFDCEYKWLTKRKPEDAPGYHQCPHCWSYAIILVERYEEDLKHLRKMFTPAEAKKIIELHKYAIARDYMQNTPTREKRYLRLLKDLAKSEKPLGAKGEGPK